MTFRLTVHSNPNSDDEDKATINARSVRFEYAKNAFNASNINWAYAKWTSLANMNDPKEGLVSRDDKVVIQQRHG